MVPGHMEDGTCFCDCSMGGPGGDEGFFDTATDFGEDAWNGTTGVVSDGAEYGSDTFDDSYDFVTGNEDDNSTSTDATPASTDDNAGTDATPATTDDSAGTDATPATTDDSAGTDATPATTELVKVGDE